ncbi:MAG: hypothetical protein IT288_07930 [Bdellovibrionales bacterium]|nr:hypothetical protein [Bdellovibrionales bacterium]
MANDDSEQESTESSRETSNEVATDPQREVLESYGISEITELDSLTLPLLIVAKNRAEFESAAAFLSRRNWPTAIATTLPEAIQSLISSQPKFVLVSANHPNPKIAKLPQIVAQAFNTKCIGFCEKSDGPSIGLLNRMQVVHRIFGQLSGPNVHRQIKKIIREEYDAAKTEKSKETSSARDEGDAAIRISGGDKEASGTVSLSGGGTKRGPTLIKGQKVDAAALLKMLDESSAEEAEQEESGVTGSAGRAFKVVQPKSIKPTAELDEKEEALKSKAFSEVQQGPKQNVHNVTQEGASGPGGAMGSEAAPGRGAKATLSQTPQSAGPATIGSGFGGGLAESQPGSSAQNSGVHGGEGAHSSRTAPSYKPEAPTTDHEALAEHTEAASLGKAKGVVQAGGNEIEVESQALAKAIKKALHEVCRENNHQTRYLVRATAVGVIPYRSGRQQGYITVAWADPTYKGRSSFLEALRFSLIDFLPIEGISADLDGEFVMDLEDVDFLKLAKAKSTGLYVQEHEGLEVGVAFFPTQERRAREKVTIDQMVPIRVDDLSPEDPVLFNTYLKMELNKKYVLYLTEGRRILKAQQERLKKNKVPGLHIGEKDFDKFIKYLHEVEVRNLVRKFSAAGNETKSA